MHAGVAGVDGGEIGRGADVGDDHAEIVRERPVADQVFDFGDFLLGDGRCACRRAA